MKYIYIIATLLVLFIGYQIATQGLSESEINHCLITSTDKSICK